MQVYKIYSAFSLLSKVPKSVTAPQQPKSWFAKLFTKNQNSATFVIQKQLFDYLQQTKIFKKEFPYLGNTERMLQNNMILHCHLLRDRIKQQVQIPRSQIQKYNYNLQAYFFPQYASFVNTAIPTKNFKQHFSQTYMKKLQLFSQMIHEHEWKISPNKSVLTTEQYAPLMRTILYENRLEVNHVELLKYCKYYVAHRKYLNMLEWNDIISHQVKWGLQLLKYIDQIERGGDRQKK